MAPTPASGDGGLYVSPDQTSVQASLGLHGLRLAVAVLEVEVRQYAVEP